MCVFTNKRAACVQDASSTEDLNSREATAGGEHEV